MKKMILIAAMVMVFLTGQSAIAKAEGVLESITTAVGAGVAEAMGKANVVVNVTTTTKDSEIKGKNVDVGVVEMGGGGNLNGIVNVTTVGGEVNADEKARVGVVTMD